MTGCRSTAQNSADLPLRTNFNLRGHRSEVGITFVRLTFFMLSSRVHFRCECQEMTLRSSDLFWSFINMLNVNVQWFKILAYVVLGPWVLQLSESEFRLFPQCLSVYAAICPHSTACHSLYWRLSASRCFYILSWERARNATTSLVGFCTAGWCVSPTWSWIS